MVSETVYFENGQKSLTEAYKDDTYDGTIYYFLSQWK
jgi:hypothetical protein